MCPLDMRSIITSFFVSNLIFCYIIIGAKNNLIKNTNSPLRAQKHRVETFDMENPTTNFPILPNNPNLYRQMRILAF